MKSECLLKIILSDIKHNMLIHYLAAAAVVMITPVIAGISELSERQAAFPLEMMSCIIGIVLMTPIFMPEQDRSIYDVVRSKKTSHVLVCAIRLVLSVVAALIFVSTLSLLMKYNLSDITLKLYMSAVGSAFAMGSLGVFSSAVGNSSIAGYMVSTGWFVMNMMVRSRLGVFDLFPVSDGCTELSIWPYASALVLSVSSLFIRKYSVD